MSDKVTKKVNMSHFCVERKNIQTLYWVLNVAGWPNMVIFVGQYYLDIFKLHLRVFILLKVSNIFHYWPLCDFDHL